MSFINFYDCKEKDLFVCIRGSRKGNTLLNCGIKDNLINFVCDEEAKQNKFLPGSKIPIVHPDVLKNEKN